MSCTQQFYILDKESGLGLDDAIVTVYRTDGSKVGAWPTYNGGYCSCTLIEGNAYTAEVTKSGYDTHGPQGFIACITPYWDIYLNETPPGKADHYLEIILLPLSWGSETALLNILSSIAEAANPLIVPLGYTYVSSDVAKTVGGGKYRVRLWYQKVGSPAVPILAILGVIALIILAIGFVIFGLAWYKHEGTVRIDTTTNAELAKTAMDTLNNAYAKGEITYDQYIEGVKIIKENLETKSIFEKIAEYLGVSTTTVYTMIIVIVALLIVSTIVGRR